MLLYSSTYNNNINSYVRTITHCLLCLSMLHIRHTSYKPRAYDYYGVCVRQLVLFIIGFYVMLL